MHKARIARSLLLFMPFRKEAKSDTSSDLDAKNDKRPELYLVFRKIILPLFSITIKF